MVFDVELGSDGDKSFPELTLAATNTVANHMNTTRIITIYRSVWIKWLSPSIIKKICDSSGDANADGAHLQISPNYTLTNIPTI